MLIFGENRYLDMFRIYFFSLLLSFFYLSSPAQNIYIPEIPDSLSNKANAIILKDKTDIQIISQEKMIEHYQTQILIKNKQADHLSEVVIFHDPYRNVNQVNLKFYNIFGKVLQKVTKKDFKDYAASGRSTLYSDSRAMVYTYTPTTYPYIVEIDYTITSENTAFIPSWHPYPGYNISVLDSEYNLIYPPNFNLYKVEKNLEKFKVISYDKVNGISYFAENLPAIEHEPLSPGSNAITPWVKLAVDKFQLAGVKGTARSWEDFGHWMTTELLKGRNKLSDESVQKIKNMVAGVNDPVERAKIIYDYVQNKVHYINVAIGIGGWQPMPASEVDKLGYGDCKALTYYTKSLLDVAGVPSIYTVVYAGDAQKSIDENLSVFKATTFFYVFLRHKTAFGWNVPRKKCPSGLQTTSPITEKP